MSSEENKKGRPPFQPTDEQRHTVSVAAGSGQMTHEEIAIGLGIDRKTLEKYFDAELSHGAYQRRLEVIDALHKQALKGNAAAVKAYLAIEPVVAPTPVPKPEPVGKKEQAQRDAAQAGTGGEWGDLLPRHAPVAPGSTTQQ